MLKLVYIKLEEFQKQQYIHKKMYVNVFFQESHVSKKNHLFIMVQDFKIQSMLVKVGQHLQIISAQLPIIYFCNTIFMSNVFLRFFRFSLFFCLVSYPLFYFSIIFYNLLHCVFYLYISSYTGGINCVQTFREF